MPKLKNAQHELFAQERVKGANVTDSAKLAGYSKKTAHVQGCRLLKNAKIIDRIKELQQKTEDKTIMTIKDRKRKLSEIARGNLPDYLTVTPEGTASLTLDKESENPGAVAELTQTIVGGDDQISVHNRKIKLNNPVPAIQELNKMDGAYEAEKVDHNINISFDRQDADL